MREFFAGTAAAVKCINFYPLRSLEVSFCALAYVYVRAHNATRRDRITLARSLADLSRAIYRARVRGVVALDFLGGGD